MSAERSTESIIDLLYGELSEEQEQEMRAELGESPELQAEYDEFDLMLGRVREAMPLEDVSPKIHASILEAARVAAEQPADDRLIRRGTPEKQSVWKRVSGGQGSQIALVAAVLIAGLFVVRAVDKSDSPLHAPASDISAMREAAPAAPAMERAAEGAGADELAEGEAAMAPAEEPVAAGEAIADQWSPDDKPTDTLVGDLADESAKDSLAAELERSKRLENQRGFDDDKGAAAQAPTPEPQPRAKPTPKPRKRVSRKSAKKPAPTRSNYPQKSAKKLEDSLNTDVFGGASDDRGTGRSTAPSSTSSSGNVQGKAGYELQATEDAEAEQKEYRPAPGSISEVDTYFREGDYGGAIRAADNFLKKGSGSTSEKASAMFIKAQSLSKQGQTAQAERTLQQLKKAYPGWNSAQVEQQLSELQRRNAPKQQKRKAKPKMDKAAEEPAEYDSLLK